MVDIDVAALNEPQERKIQLQMYYKALIRALFNALSKWQDQEKDEAIHAPAAKDVGIQLGATQTYQELRQSSVSFF